MNTKTKIKLITGAAILSTLLMVVPTIVEDTVADDRRELVSSTVIGEPCGLDSVVCADELVGQKIFGYSSTEDQTDGDPLVTASNQHVRDGIIANNCKPFGTRVMHAGKIYEVQDRMNRRYGCDVWDVWFPSRNAARQWGLKRDQQIQIINDK